MPERQFEGFFPMYNGERHHLFGKGRMEADS